ncbi:MAG: J domain-containing protein [Alphaproteobacteria bacterium]|nr:J domain-containing protein [Alphaproteobacteria bacterium]
MSSFPWDVLGIEPTSDEAAIQRAYARQLRRYRPDEDFEGFQRLVAARKLALELASGGGRETPGEPATAWQQSGSGDGQGFSSRDSGAGGNRSQDGAKGRVPQPSEGDGPRGFSSRDLCGTVIFATDRRDTPDGDRAFTEILARLRRLVDGSGECGPGPIWDAAEWRAVLTRIDEVSLTERRSLREFILRQALPVLGDLPSDEVVTRELREDRGPGAVVLLWEEEFGFEPEQAGLVRFCGVPAMLCYLSWLRAARRLTIALEQQRAREQAFAEAMVRLEILVHGTGGSGPTWDGGKWRMVLRQMKKEFPERSVAVREFIAREGLSALPKLLSGRAAMSALREDHGPGVVVMLWEDAFGFDLFTPDRFCRDGAMRRYRAWLAATLRLKSELDRERARALAVAQAMSRLKELIHGTDRSGPTWDGGKWQTVLHEISTEFPEQLKAVRGFIVREALSVLPKMPSEARMMEDLREGSGPGVVAVLWEERFALEADEKKLARLCGRITLYQYRAWLERTRRLKMELDRERARALAVAEAMARLKALIHGTGGSGPTWDGGIWRTVLCEIAREFPEQLGAVRGFIVREALSALPRRPSEAMMKEDLRQERGPCAVVVLWEESFALEADETKLAQVCGKITLYQYRAWLDSARSLRIGLARERERSLAFAEAISRFTELVFGTTGSGPTWDAAPWRRWLGEMSFEFPEQREAVREFVIREALPVLPELPSDASVMEGLRETCGPGLVVLFWEDEFALASDQTELARLCGAPAMLRYLGWLDSTQRLTIELERERARAMALAEAMARLRELVGGMNGSGPTWDAAPWRRWLGEMSSEFPEQREAVRDFVVREALPVLPQLPSDASVMEGLREGCGPGLVARLWEEAFALASDQTELARFCGAPAMLRYLVWLDCTRRLTIDLERERARAMALAEAMARLKELVFGTNGSGPTWDVAPWRAWLGEMSSEFPEHREAVGDFIVRDAVPVLPELPSDAALMEDLRQESGPGPVVLLWEETFGFEREAVNSVRLFGMPAWLCYFVWLKCTRRLTMELDRERAVPSIGSAFRQAMAAMACLQKLVRGDKGSGPVWDVAKWRLCLGEMSAGFPGHSDALREFIIREALPFLPEPPSQKAMMEDLRKGSGPGLVVLLWEEELLFELDEAELVRLCGALPTCRYLDWLDATRRLEIRLDRERARELEFAQAMARLEKLLHGNWAGPTWDAAKWRPALRAIAEGFPEQREVLRKFMLREALSRLPKLPLPAVVKADLREGSGPGPVVLLWEEEFAFEADLPACALFCGVSAAEDYVDWLDAARRVTAELERDRVRARASGEITAWLRNMACMGEGSGPIWIALLWQDCMSEISARFPAERDLLRELIVRNLLPLLPALDPLSVVTSDMREGCGPAAVVAFWEDQLSIANHPAFSRVPGEPAMLRYLEWLEVAVRACPLEQRSTAEHHFMERLDRVLPPLQGRARGSSRGTWQPARWEELFVLVRKMAPAELSRCRDLLAERLTAALPKLPWDPWGLLARFGVKTGPASVVEAIERKFAISERFDAPSVDAAGVQRYRDWLNYARRSRTDR